MYIYYVYIYLHTYIYIYIYILLNVLSVNTESLFQLSSGLSSIFLIPTAAENYIYKVGSFAVEIRFQNK